MLKGFKIIKQYGILCIGFGLMCAGLVIPGFFGGFISGQIYNTQDQLEKSDYRFFWSNGDGQFTYIMNVPLKISTNRDFQLFPNDCVTKVVVNNREFTGLAGDLCNNYGGVALSISDYLKIGDNSISVSISESGGSKSLYLKPSIHDPARMYSILLIGFGWFLILIFWFRKYFVWRIRWHGVLVLCLFGLMFGLGLQYTIKSEFFQRSHDLTGHLDYIKLILRGERMPISDACWQCYHSNIYYRFSRALYRFGQWIGRSEPYELIRIITWLFWWVGIGFATRFIYTIFYDHDQKRSFFSLLTFFLALSLFYFWPLQFYYGPKITNEIFHYVCTYIGLYYALLARYDYRSGDDHLLKRHTFLAFVWNIVGMFIKSNSIVRIPIGLFPLLLRLCGSWFTTGIKGIRFGLKQFKRLLLRIIVLSLLSAGLLGRVSYVKGIHGIVDNADRLSQGNSVASVPVYEAFSTFHIKEFLGFLAMRDSTNDAERRSFWNFLSKTSITGEMGVTTIKNVRIFPYFMMTSLILFVLLIINVANSSFKKGFTLIGLLVPIVAMMLYRIIYPLAASMHFRYILPSLLFIIYYLVLPWGKIESWDDVRFFDVILFLTIVAFLLFSLYFAIPAYF